MPEKGGRPGSRIEPTTAWTVVTDSPLKGLAFAREAGAILAWDEGNQLYLLNTRGETLSTSRVPNRIVAGSISDEASLIALLVDADDGGLLLLSADFDILSERPAPSEASFVAIDPHGRYIALATRQNVVSVVSRFGRGAGRIETMEPMSHLCFVPGRPFLVGAAAYGMLLGIELEPGRTSGRLDAEIVWQDRLMSNVGRLALDGEGSMILASCFTLGIQRYDLTGRNEGSYHLGGTVSHAVPDFPGRTIAAATLEGELAVMNSGGNVRWRTRLARPVIALEIDPLGRFIIFGHATGEIVRLDLFADAQPGASPRPERRAAAPAAQTARSASGSVRVPDWMVQAVQSDQQWETAVISVIDEPATIALFTSPHRLQLFSTAGKKLFQGPDLSGVGRILRWSPGWLAAATDRQILLCDLKRHTERRLDVSLVQLTHLAIKPDDFGLALIQERDRIGRLSLAGRWVWKQELRTTVEDLAVDSQGFAAVTTNSGELLIFDPAGKSTVGFTFDATDPPLLIEAPEHSPAGVAWLTLTRRGQWLRGHGQFGEVIWDQPIPWEGWTLSRVGRLAIVTAANGQALASNGSGSFVAQSPPSGDSNDAFGADAHGEPIRVSRRGVHIISAAFDGRVRWRSVTDQPLGPIAAGSAGIAIMLGKSLAWFAHDQPAATAGLDVV